MKGSSSDSGEEYRGTWSEDKMHGYGVYRYINGAIYSGEWVNGKQEGRVIIIVLIRCSCNLGAL